MTTAERAVWTPSEPEVRALVRAGVWTAFRRDVVILLCVCGGAGLLVLPLTGPSEAAVTAGVPLLVLVPFFLLVTHRRNARVIGAAYPVGREASAEARETGLFLDTAIGASELPWARLVDPTVHEAVVRVRDTVARRRVVIPRQLFPDAWLERLGAPARDA